LKSLLLNYWNSYIFILKVLRKVVNNVWPNLAQVWVGNDLETALACIDDDKFTIKCIVISGTGSCCYGNNGKVNAKIGGYGHILGLI
jgi:N-acetylglucosamine kinase-like BadF-type ATPase